jgi:hypothetical protein
MHLEMLCDDSKHEYLWRVAEVAQLIFKNEYARLTHWQDMLKFPGMLAIKKNG